MMRRAPMLPLPRLIISEETDRAPGLPASRALVAALRAGGLEVAAFLLGPDPQWGSALHALTGRPVHGLDPWLMGAQVMRRTVLKGAEGAHLALVVAPRAVRREVPIAAEFLAAPLVRGELLPELDVVLALAAGASPLDEPQAPARGPRRCVIAVALDEAFDGHFEDDLDRLEAAGAELVPFSPLADDVLPEADGLLLVAASLEEHSAALVRARRSRQEVSAFARSGRPIVAFDGGLTYLTRGLRTASGNLHPFTGVLDTEAVACTTGEPPERVEALTDRPTILGPARLRLRGHARRRSRLTSAREGYDSPYCVVRGAVGVGVGTSTLFGAHFRTHWAASPLAAEAFVDACLAGASASATRSPGWFGGHDADTAHAEIASVIADSPFREPREQGHSSTAIRPPARP